MIKFPCHNCSANNEAEDGDAGALLLCGNCGANVLVPNRGPTPAKKAIPVATRMPVLREPAAPKVVERIVYVEREPEPKKKSNGCALAVLLLLLGFVFMIFRAALYPPPGGRISSGGVRDREVIRLAQGMVRSSLRAPSTAKFVDEECSASPTTENKWVAVVVVDAQNGFGAMLRNRYEVELWPEYKGSDDWKGRIVSGD